MTKPASDDRASDDPELYANLRTSAQLISRFVREAKAAAARVGHPRARRPTRNNP